jgi:integrase
MTMRRSWGSITRLGTNRYRLRWWANGDDGYRRRTEIVHGTRKEASDRLAAIRVEHTSDAPIPTVGDVWRRWVLPDKERAHANGSLATNTLASYRSTWERHVAPRWENVPCDAVHPVDVQTWLDTKTRTVAQSSLSLARQVMQYAMRYEIVSANPFTIGYTMPTAGTRRDKGTWTLDEIVEMWEGLRGTWAEASFILCAFGGCRVGESLGVLASEVELTQVDGFDVALVPIERQVTVRGLTDRLKTRTSRRTVVVCGEPARALADLASHADHWLVDDGLGHPTTNHAVNVWWRETGADHPYRNLRNAWQTYMRWELLVPPYLIETLMGHVTDGVTGQYYDRPTTLQMASTVAKAFGTLWDTRHPMHAV